MLAGQIKQLSNSTLTYIDCYICGKEYPTWRGLFYHKRKVHNCTNVRSSRYEYEIKNATKLEEKEETAGKCMFCSKRFRKETMKDHYRKSIQRISRGLSVNLAVVNIEKRCLKITLSGIIYILKVNTT